MVYARLLVDVFPEGAPIIDPNEEVVLNLDHVVLWKGRGKGKDAKPIDVLLSNGMWIEVNATTDAFEKLTGAYAGIVQ